MVTTRRPAPPSPWLATLREEVDRQIVLARFTASRAIKEHTPDSLVLLACTKCRRGRRVRPRDLDLGNWPQCCSAGQLILVPELRAKEFIEEA